ncbi:hypothetical protein C8Q80DRAFT_1158351 [Daedaleopsis nitida]|nr:hypothetical protein C8Q80DRAFT_1158351 [Daedaleopsis nitida]
MTSSEFGYQSNATDTTHARQVGREEHSSPNNPATQPNNVSGMVEEHCGDDDPMVVDEETASQHSSYSSTAHEAERNNHSATEQHANSQEQDVANSISGLFRVLDLIQERGSGGLVDKIIISQDALGRLINDLYPNAYTSITKVDFSALDRVEVRPIGIYGSKAAIVDFLQKKAVVDKATASLILRSSEITVDGTCPSLSSGLYILRHRSDPQMYAIYWPEDTTWDDDCSQSVRRNRITFIRYLTKIADQVVCLLSNEHAESIVWKRDEVANDDIDIDMEDDDDRMFLFEVAKTSEQEENVTARPGFEIRIPAVASSSSYVPRDAEILPPQLVRGEMRQAIVTTMYIPAKRTPRPSQREVQEQHLRQILHDCTIRLDKELTSEGLKLLLELGLRHGAPEAIEEYKKAVANVEKLGKETLRQKLSDTIQQVEAESVSLDDAIAQYLMDILVERYPILGNCNPKADDTQSRDTPMRTDPDRVRELASAYPEIKRQLDSATKGLKLSIIRTPQYGLLKARILSLDFLFRENVEFNDEQRRALVQCPLDENLVAPAPSHRTRSSFFSKIGEYIGVTSSINDTPVIEVPPKALRIDDQTFLSKQLPSILQDQALLTNLCTEVVTLVHQQLRDALAKEGKDLSSKVESALRSARQKTIKEVHAIDQVHQLQQLHRDLLKVLTINMGSNEAKARVTIERIEMEEPGYHGLALRRGATYKVKMYEEIYSEPEVRYTVYPLELTQVDSQRMRVQEDSKHVPTPVVHAQSAASFTLPTDTTVLYMHLLSNGRFMVVTRERTKDCSIYLSPLNTIDAALRRRPLKILKRDKVGEHFLYAYDESKRMFAVCSMAARDTPMQLHVFEFDETFTSLQGTGMAVNLSTWYDSAVTIKHLEFVNGTGSEELIFVDDSSRVRKFSLLTQQFRPATLQLPRMPSAVCSTPDGSCLFAIEAAPANVDTAILRAYHWSSFGSDRESSSDGITIHVPNGILPCHVVTSVLSRNNVYLLGLDLEKYTVQSVAFEITRKVTEFTFKEKGAPSSSSQGRKDQVTYHNSLVDCHAEVWTRFPVVPAVRRETTSSSAVSRKPRCLTFVSNVGRSSFGPHFAALIEEFEQSTKKPAGDELKSLRILTVDQRFFPKKLPFTPSTFRAGEWLVELLCLIPIHIAVTRDNRFIPLKDGVWSSELEKSLLGAEVAKIVDSITFGWYESLFQSYMATKPVKVVSSMGEQSVGKSFALNHLADTSFAGSAMRTTEGVWMSVTPTESTLVVALDFEGVHSIERSAQEDTLLVLFNTAISNLVLFRNNYALSRDITGLFQSFQSSASVLDPEANPMLFQSELMIIIKDVPDSDKNDIKKEFQLKFQQIVQAEQGNNFITRLHRNRLNIVPWPVIGSKPFYTLFNAVKRRLDLQPVTHAGGAVFMQTMKTLMAKLKANDWGAMSQNLATHRVHLLSTILPRALAFGASEIAPDIEPLIDFDTAAVIESRDTSSRLHLTSGGPQDQPASKDEAMRSLRESWGSHGDRDSHLDSEWKDGLQRFLDQTVDLRVEHVQAWLQANTAKYPPTHSDVQLLFREFNDVTIDLKASVRLCSAKCSECNLGCLLSHHHEGVHDCHTDHACHRTCQFVDADHDDDELCGLRAGHPGSHLCNVLSHLCGKPCKLSGKRNCQNACVKMVDHEDEDHVCSATSHECGQPCSLSNVTLHHGNTFSCDGLCRIASDIPHHEHRCDNMQCPIECQLCKRLCSGHDHLHGLDSSELHLCGQEHPCKALCQAGICQIETAPQSVEATFTGRHETFQYTKYNQESKRLPCAIVIPPGELEHHGRHMHDLGPKPFHFCDMRCPDCGYYCTLPLGHTQQEHETSHGSMSKTRWAVDGPDGTVLEVNGRKFGANDDGAPMLCSMYCLSMGRHAHIAWCRSDDPRRCGGPDHEHINTPLQPEPSNDKDWISHSLYWKRIGFKDPYSQEDQANFAKCDRMCSGAEHNRTGEEAAQPSYCTLPILHPPFDPNMPPEGGIGGYISDDGHAFLCRNPALLRQAYHVIFVIDRSSSMGNSDRRPLANTPTTQLIRRTHDNRLGAVFSSLYGFWEARHRTIAANGNAPAARQDAYSVILFDNNVTTPVTHNFMSTPLELLGTVLQHPIGFGTKFERGLQGAQTLMENHWSTERAPVIVFLSDGECSLNEAQMHALCRRSIALGKPLSFHAVAFGPYTRALQQMAHIAQEVERNAPPDALNQYRGIPSSYTEALDTVELAETFLGIATSLGKPRGALFRG